MAGLSTLGARLRTASDDPGHLGLVAVGALVFLSRLPFIGAGYGLDSDAYRVVNATIRTLETGQYQLSRFPGYPVHETATALLVRGGPLLTNGVTALLSAFAFGFCFLIAKRWNLGDGLLAALAFAFTPIVYVSSATTIDYMWAIAFGLGSLYLVIERRPILGGLLLGLAIGCRVTSGALVIPIAIYELTSDRPREARKRVTHFLATALGVGAACYLPVLQLFSQGPLTLAPAVRHRPWQRVLSNATINVWGTLGCVALGCVFIFLLCRWKSVRAALADRRRRRLALVCGSAIAVFTLGFLALPHEAGYLIPAVPFALFLLCLVTPPAIRRPAFVLVILSSFLLTLDRQSVRLAGPIFEDHEERHTLADRVQSIHQRIEEMPGKPLLVATFLMPRLEALTSGEAGSVDHRYVGVITSAEEYENYIRDGYSVLFIRGAEVANKTRFGVDLKKLGAVEFSEAPPAS